MYGSYGSYSSMSVLSAPMDITSSNLRAHDATCAFPSWPRRSSLSDSDRQERATSFLSDDDLFLSDPFEDDAHSVSSTSSASSPGLMESPPHVMADVVMDAQRHQAAMQRELMRQVVSEKERRRQQQAMMKKSQRRSSPKKSPKSKLSSMTPIQENAE
ncbi:hypothetical protein HJFPF1_06635 [Paramyrothecium foliicola]|nr:hypothetical protein HJFPF1_06635 [Paramyrothecium foliicola]